jgi:hypothetical protein
VGHNKLQLWWCVVLLGALPWAVHAATYSVTYLGTLLQNGLPADGVYRMQFQLYADERTPTALALMEMDVEVTQGVFSAEVGALFEHTVPPVFLALAVRGPTDPAFDVLPRVMITAVPYAQRAATADAVDWMHVQNVPPLVPGATGPQGPPGTTGASGPPGAAGATGPQCATPMTLVFQLASEDNLPFIWGDDGTAHITQCPHHQEQLTFDWACY